jgi:hypothetical protein
MKFLKYILVLFFLSTVSYSFTQTTIGIGVSANPICSGTGVTFNSQVNNCSNPQYQWYVNNVAISGATSSSYFSNSLNNGDVIYCRQTNTTTCTAAQSNSFTMTVYSLPTLTLISASGTNNQTVCQYNYIDTIKYAYTGSNLTFSISGLPVGISTSFANGVYKIYGSATQIGTFNYTLTASTTSSFTEWFI